MSLILKILDQSVGPPEIFAIVVLKSDFLEEFVVVIVRMKGIAGGEEEENGSVVEVGSEGEGFYAGRL